MAKLINGDGNKAIYADQDADLIASICGNVTCIAAVGGEYAATQEDANTIGLADGVIITKEGRRIQLDTGYTDLFDIPTGTAGVTNYYIIGYHLYINDDNAQVCETFVQKMNSSTETITEDTFKGGATEVYVSVYRVTQVGLNISTIFLLLAKLSNISKINSDLSDIKTITDGSATPSTNGASCDYSIKDGVVYVRYEGPISALNAYGVVASNLPKSKYRVPIDTDNGYFMGSGATTITAGSGGSSAVQWALISFSYLMASN